MANREMINEELIKVSPQLVCNVNQIDTEQALALLLFVTIKLNLGQLSYDVKKAKHVFCYQGSNVQPRPLLANMLKLKFLCFFSKKILHLTCFSLLHMLG